METLADRIRAAADRVGGVSQLASQLEEVSRRSLFDYVSGKAEPKASTLLQIARVTGSDVNWLFGLPTAPAVQDGALVSVPRYEARASAGSGGLIISDRVAEHFGVSRDWLSRNLPRWAPTNARVGVLEGAGDSMEPTIRDGDLVMVVQDVPMDVFEAGGIFVFGLDGRLLLKRLQVLNSGDLLIISDNKAYATETVKHDELEHRVEVYAQVFFVGGRPRSFS